MVSVAERSEIANFFREKNVFVTGGTGFLGKALVEKLLRSCTGIQTVYVLVREKKGKNANTRVQEMCKNTVFDRLREAQPNFTEKIVGISGDVALTGLGMDVQIRHELAYKVSIIFHVAASVNFEEKLNKAVAINLEGTKEIIKFARECRNLDSIVHVSTAFTQCPLNKIEEKFYPTPYDPEELIELAKNTPESNYPELLPKLLGKWPNIYTFSKAVAEAYLSKTCQDLPICISRPAMVTCAMKEPIPGWIDSLNGPAGFILGVGCGVLRIAHVNEYSTAELVPVDMVVNSMIACAHKTAKDYRKVENSGFFEIPIYNFVSSSQNRFTWKGYKEYLLEHGHKVPLEQAFWYMDIWLCNSKFLFTVFSFLMHTVPAILADLFCLVTFQKRRFYSLVGKIDKFLSVITYFATQSWSFTNDNVRFLWHDLSETDKEIFPFDVATINYNSLMKDMSLAVRKYIVKDDISSIPRAKRKQFMLYLVHQAVKLLIYFLLFRLFYRALINIHYIL